MKWIKKHISTVLMVLSLALLIIFIGFWLKASYKGEEANLTTKLEFEMSKANAQIKQNMMFKILEEVDSSFANEVLSIKKVFIRKTIDDKKGKSVLDLSENKIRSLDETIITLKMEDHDTTIRSTFKTNTEIKNLRATDGKYLEDIKAIFIKGVEDQQFPKSYTFIEDSVVASANKVIDIYIADSELFGEGKSFARFENYSIYIYNKILPQILFSFLLVLVICVSFWQNFITLKKEKRLHEMKSNFVSNMAHELKTPISTVSVAIEALKDFDVLEDKTKSKEYLNISKNELSRLTLLIDKVLKMSKFDDQNQIVKKEEDIDFLEIINSVSNSMQLQFERYEAQYELDFRKGDYNFKGDKVHITNVLYNLIDNALKYGGERPRVLVRLESFADKLVMSVKDSGIGIPKEYQDKIFDRFFRVPDGDLHNTKGHGLGLNYANNVIEAHGGSLYFESQKGKGSKFTIEIPKND